MIVLDTNVLSELMRPVPAPQVLRWVDAQEPTALAVTAVNVAELLYGVARLLGGQRKDLLVDAVHAMVSEDLAGRVLPFDDRAAFAYAEIVSGRERAGRPVSMADGQIAAICRSRGTALATRDGRGFADTGLTLHDPWSD